MASKKPKLVGPHQLAFKKMRDGDLAEESALAKMDAAWFGPEKGSSKKKTLVFNPANPIKSKTPISDLFGDLKRDDKDRSSFFGDDFLEELEWEQRSRLKRQTREDKLSSLLEDYVKDVGVVWAARFFDRLLEFQRYKDELETYKLDWPNESQDDYWSKKKPVKIKAKKKTVKKKK